MKKKQAEGHENTERWLLTYADMITLLMLFFIILYSMSTRDKGKFEALAQALEAVFAGGNFGVFDSQPFKTNKGLMENLGKYPADRSRSKKKAILHKFSSALYSTIQAGKVRVTTNEMGVAIILSSDMFFDSGSARINPEEIQTLEKVAKLISEMNNNVRIEGHTDNRVLNLSNTQFRSNWELSGARALNILEFFESYGLKSDRMSSVAFGSTRPMVPNESPEDRALNRRVEIIIVEEK
jgi:chemotaxis protein MotB